MSAIEKPRPTRDELRAAIAQAMQSVDTPLPWMPDPVFDALAEAALSALTGPVEIPEGLDARPTIAWTVHCSHCGGPVRDGHFDAAMVFDAEGIAGISGDYYIGEWDRNIDGRVLVCSDCTCGWCPECGEEVYPWQDRRVRDDEAWHVDCARGSSEPAPGLEFEVPGELSKTPPVPGGKELDETIRRANDGIVEALAAVVDTEATLAAIKERGAGQ